MREGSDVLFVWFPIESRSCPTFTLTKAAAK